MENPYDLHSWSKRYREEALREARVRDLARPTRSSGGAQPSGTRAAPIRTSLLSLLGRKQVAG
jgi:hypothetical protein